jgi:glycosidase
MTNHPWYNDAIFYHIYPLGFCGAPEHNDFNGAPVERLSKIQSWLPHIQELGMNALYLGPVFESTRHGYDTANYYEVDRRLGDRSTLAALSKALHERGMKLILDGVFNHTGRDFWAFRDVQQFGSNSAYKDWFSGLRFDAKSPYGDPFTYEAWNGHYDLVRLNQANPELRDHLFNAIRMWVEEFDIDGLRLDAADCLDVEFMQALQRFCKSLKPDFWLLGEVIHGDYRKWANPETLHSVTNYECYKGLYSSLNDRNFYEIAWSLNRQFGPEGLYTLVPLYTFVDNHDVDRIASRLQDPALLNLLYLLLFTMPGIPSIYYGSEWGITGVKNDHSDSALRPCLDLENVKLFPPQSGLVETITNLSRLRLIHPALRHGDYQQLHVAHQHLAFLRSATEESICVLLNAAEVPTLYELKLPFSGKARDILNPERTFLIEKNILRIDQVPARQGLVLICENV